MPEGPSQYSYILIIYSCILIIYSCILIIYSCILIIYSYILIIYSYILIIMGCNCGFVMPLGTVLGVFTFIVMMRPTVKVLLRQQ